MNTHNFGEKRSEVAPPTEGEVVSVGASEFQILKQEIKKLKDVSIIEEENKITILKEGLQIKLESNFEGDYWDWNIKVEDGNDKAEIYISSAKQVCELKLYPINQKVDINYKIKNEYIEEDLYICTKAEYALDEIRSILITCDVYGILRGLFEYFKTEFLEPQLFEP